LIVLGALAFASRAVSQVTVLPAPKNVSNSVAARGADSAAVTDEFNGIVRAFHLDWPKARSISLRVYKNSSLGDEEYRLTIKNGVVAEASTATGMAWALNTLGQLSARELPKQCVIRDKPDVPFRCLMVDAARRYHSLSTLRTLIRWCAAGKVRYMQLHLTDDQNWMFPTKVFPGVDGHNNSGKAAYSAGALKSLQGYAEARGITIIPEIDMPGHSSLLTRLDPALFSLHGSPSTNCINFASAEVRGVMKELLKEVAVTFPKSPYIHIGCDEAWFSDAEKDPHVAAAMKANGGGPSEVFIDFISEMANAVLHMGKTPLIWEGFQASTYSRAHISRQAVVVAWDGNSYPAARLIQDGFSVINGGMDPFYIINHYPYDLNTMAPLPKLYRANTLHFASFNGAADFTFQEPTKVLGSMLCWWEGFEWNAQTLLPQRILAFGARLWNAQGESDYKRFLARSQTVMDEVNSSLFPFELSLSGGLRSSPMQFEKQLDIRLKVNSTASRFVVFQNGKPLVPSRPGVYSVVESGVLSVAEISGRETQEQIGETLLLPLKKVVLVPNLALNCSVTVSGDDDPQFSGSRVTNGVSGDLTNYWLALPNPQFLTVDLGKSRAIARIEVVCYWATGEPTKYRLSVSEDGKNWLQVVDASKQSGPSTDAGYVYRITPTNARYVRIETLGGSLYPSAMTRINQIRVFGD
jgi:hexosaminidase